MSPIRTAPLLLAALVAWSLPDTAQGAAQFKPVALEVNGEGIAVAKAVLTLPGSPDLVRHLLTDPTNWPNLFPSPVRIQSVIRHENSAVTDMVLSPSLFLGDLHMVVETREVTPLHLETALVRGDVRQYRHVWRLTPLAGKHCTRAALELTMQLRTWIPTWMLRWLVRTELDGHLERVGAEARRLAGHAADCDTGQPPGPVRPVDSQNPLP